MRARRHCWGLKLSRFNPFPLDPQATGHEWQEFWSIGNGRVHVQALNNGAIRIQAAGTSIDLPSFEASALYRALKMIYTDAGRDA